MFSKNYHNLKWLRNESKEGPAGEPQNSFCLPLTKPFLLNGDREPDFLSQDESHKYRHISFYCTSQILPFFFFLQLEGLCNPASNVYRCLLFFANSICSLCVAVSRFDNSHNISNFFVIIIFVMVI